MRQYQEDMDQMQEEIAALKIRVGATTKLDILHGIAYGADVKPGTINDN